MSFGIWHNDFGVNMIECQPHQAFPHHQMAIGDQTRTVAISQDMQKWYGLDNYTYYIQTPLLKITPTNFTQNNTDSIVVEAMYFPQIGGHMLCDLLCEFIGTDLSAQYIVAHYINSTHITCDIPKSPIAQIVRVRVLTNGVTSTLNYLEIEFNPQLELIDISPDILKENTETVITVTLRGSECYEYYYLYQISCNFGNDFIEYTTASSMSYDVESDSTMIECISPLLPVTDENRLQFWLSHSETKEIITSIWSHGIIVVPEPLITSMSMYVGPAAVLPIEQFASSPTVEVTGLYFYHFIDAHCKFIQMATNLTSVLPAEWVANDTVKCTVKNAGSEPDHVSLTDHYLQIVIGENGVSSQWNMTFDILYDAQISKVYPTHLIDPLGDMHPDVVEESALLIIGLYFTKFSHSDYISNIQGNAHMFACF